MPVDWTAALPEARNTGDKPVGGVAADMNLVHIALAEIRSSFDAMDDRVTLTEATSTAVSVNGTPVTTYDIDSTPVGVGDLAGVSQSNARVGGALSAVAVTSPGTGGAVVTGWSVQDAQSAVPIPPVGDYFYPISGSASTTSAVLGNGTLRVAPWLVPTTLSIDRIAGDISVVGEAGAKLRWGIYSDTGNAYPGALLLDAGQIAGDSATVQQLTITSLDVSLRLVWIGAVVQSVTTTQPTVRVVSAWTPPVMIRAGTSLPSAGGNGFGYSMGGVTAALPGTFSTTVSPSGFAPRPILRRA